MNQELPLSFPNGISVTVKREDLLHPFVSGNKFRKLKYNLLQAKNEGHTTLLTFGGAYSNHIAATAYAGQEQGFKTIGLIRGEELSTKIVDNPTLKFAQNCGMELHFISRENYRNKTQPEFIHDLKDTYGSFFLIPEGGTNPLAIQGCTEILTPTDYQFDYICCAVGTGGTISGIINSAQPHQQVLGFPALKGDFLTDEISAFVTTKNWQLINDYHFGGYGKINESLIDFINHFYKTTQIPLDPIYTGKMMYGIQDLIAKAYFPTDAKILLIHTGGIQGIYGMNLKIKNKKLPTIDIHV